MPSKMRPLYQHLTTNGPSKLRVCTKEKIARQRTCAKCVGNVCDENDVRIGSESCDCADKIAQYERQREMQRHMK